MQVLGVLAVVVVEVALFLAAGAAATRTSTNNLKLWTGTVSTPGASTVTVAFPVSVTSIDTGLSAQEFSASSGSSTAWGTDTGGGISNTSSATVTFPKLTPKGTGELYFGYDATANPASAGTTSGFHYAITSSDDIVAYDTNVSSAVQPTARSWALRAASQVGWRSSSPPRVPQPPLRPPSARWARWPLRTPTTPQPWRCLRANGATCSSWRSRFRAQRASRHRRFRVGV